MNKTRRAFESKYRVIIATSKRLYPHKPDIFLVWVSLGVFFGYPENEIIEFCRRMLSGEFAPMGTPFFGTGYISSEGFSETREEHIASINQRRYCKYPFPTEDPDAAHHIKKLFTQEEFFCKITSIANKV